ncbi:hypothetical protein OCS_06795 [Ophiocordyceps sinensis CO18]|uniref:Uncharacterized protein n=1 Tax=Ophiocordyceps sinensis (strain Co18 / CGMCC 3.14243) TaxID=911162 RepID=T5A6P8_OPHSC|nr:hypothetical protein OCS_06795 [Ophiocordyceps sinensis CO18]
MTSTSPTPTAAGAAAAAAQELQQLEQLIKSELMKGTNVPQALYKYVDTNLFFNVSNNKPQRRDASPTRLDAKAGLALALALVSLGSLADVVFLANVIFLALPSSNNPNGFDSSKSASCCKSEAAAARFVKPAKPTPHSKPAPCSTHFARSKQQLFGLLFRPSKQLIKLLPH